MNVSIIGSGHVGLATGVALGHVGLAITCVDTKERVVERLRAREPTIHEHGFPELLRADRDRFGVRAEHPAAIAMLNGLRAPTLERTLGPAPATSSRRTESTPPGSPRSASGAARDGAFAIAASAARVD